MFLQTIIGIEREPLLQNEKNYNKSDVKTEDNGAGSSYSSIKYDPHIHREVDHPTSNVDTLIHLVKGNIGTGILAMPEAFKNAGLYGGLFGLSAIGIICIHCMHILLACSHELCRRRKISSMDYAEVCYSAFATRQEIALQKAAIYAKYTINSFLCVSQFGFCSVYILFVARNLQYVVDHYYGMIDVRYFLLILLLPIIAVNFLKNLKYLVPVSIIASILTIASIIIIFHFILHDLPSVDSRPKTASLAQLPLFFGTAVYAFEGIGSLLPLENNMKKPSSLGGFTGVLNVGMGIVAVLYLSIGFFGYLKYGDSIAASITLNLDGDSILAELVRVMYAIAIFFSYCIQFYIPMQILGPWFHKIFSEENRKLTDGILRISFIISTVVLAAVVPKLGPIISLLGAVFSSSLALIFPPILEYLTFELNGMGYCYWKLWKNTAILLFGIVGFVFGAYVSMLELLQPEPLFPKP